MKRTGTSSEPFDRSSEEADDFKKKFGELPLNEKLATLVHLEVATMSEALNTIIDKSISASGDVIDKLAGRASTKGTKK